MGNELTIGRQLSPGWFKIGIYQLYHFYLKIGIIFILEVVTIGILTCQPLRRSYQAKMLEEIGDMMNFSGTNDDSIHGIPAA